MKRYLFPKNSSPFQTVKRLILSGCLMMFILSFPVMVLLFPAAAVSADSHDDHLSRLVICDSRTVDILGYPPAMTSGSPFRHSAPALETLFRLTPDGQLLPWLAVSYEARREQKELILILREGVTFHDGSAFNAEAVKWNLLRQAEASATGTSHISDILVTGEYELTVLLDQWDNTLLPSLCQVQGLIISPSSCENNGTEWAFSHPVGTGPFRFLSRAENGTITYQKYSRYWQEEKPCLDMIQIVCDTDASSREAHFRSGDYSVLIRGDLSSLAGFSAEGYTIQAVASTGPWGLIFDSADPESPFSDIRVRQAVCHAINRETLANTIYLDTVTLTNQYALPGMDTYNEEVAGYTYDPDLSRRLLSEAGYPEGFSTVFSYDETADSVDALAHTLQSMLERVGIRLTLNPVSNSLSTRMLLGGKGWDGIMGTFGSAQYDTLTQLYNYMVGDEKYISMEKPAELTETILHALSADPEESLDMVRKIQTILIDDYCLCCYLFGNSDYTVLHANVLGTGLSTTMPVTAWTPEDARIEAP